MAIESKSNHFLNSLKLPLLFVVFIAGVHALKVLLQLNLGIYGVLPRTGIGLRGVLFSPLIHSDWGHLFSNIPPLFITSALILFFYRKVAYSSITLIYFLSGLSVWLFGRQVFHIGASGVIYGLVSFVFFTGLFRRNIKSIALALIIVLYYGSMIWGILPGQEGISWESHLLGGVVGALTAFLFKNNLEADEEKKVYSWEKEEAEPNFFLERDAFEKTKLERKQEIKATKKDTGFWTSDSTLF